ncbi:MAG: hypothetical protein IJT08_03575 [Alphaproteobacteria bacterium]|nr:hypothetical protein [Alphaproteobacteria bacterium]
MPEHKKLEANGAAKIDPNDFAKAQSSEDEDPRASNSKLYADSISDIRTQLGDLIKQNERLKRNTEHLKKIKEAG